MSQELAKAQALIKKMATDPKFAKRVQLAPTPQEKYKILEEHGFGGITEADVKPWMMKAESFTDLEELDEQDLAVVQNVCGWVGVGLGGASVAIGTASLVATVTASSAAAAAAA